MENIKPMENQYNETKFKILNETDPYKIIGVSDNASLDEINKNYKNLAREFHPDRHSGLNGIAKKEIEVLFTKITTAFNLLKDDEERKKFDYEKRMRLQKEEILSEIKNRNGSGPISQSGGIDISGLFTDTKVNAGEIRNKKAEKLFKGSIYKYNKGELDSAIADLQSAIELNSKVACYHSSLGLIMKEKGWNGYAQAEFKIALSLDPNDNLALEYYKSVPVEPTPLNKNQAEAKEKPGNGILNRFKTIFKKF